MPEVRIKWDKWTELVEKMCDDYCYFANVMNDQDALDQKCDECPLNNVASTNYPLGYCPQQE